MTASLLARCMLWGLAACCGCALIQDFDDYRSASSTMPAEVLPACGEVGLGVPCASGASSCEEADGACSAETGKNAACCATIRLTGGTFSRGFDYGGAAEDGTSVLGWVEKDAAPATVPPFALDRYEVTVGRFRAFVDAYDAFRKQLPQLSGQGAVPSEPASGWAASFESSLPASELDLREQLLRRADVRCAWTQRASGTENLPINCVNWSVALLFCIWDGGRLPSEAEWNFVAAVGDEQRPFAGSLRGPFDPTLGVVDAIALAPVGSRPKGATPSGHHDLAGNVQEWVYDACQPVTGTTSCDPKVYPLPCDHGCVGLDGSNRWLRGGSFKFPAADARSSARLGVAPNTRFEDTGFRCARDL